MEASNSSSVPTSVIPSLPSTGCHRLHLNNITSSTVTSRSIMKHRSPSANLELITPRYDGRLPCLRAYESNSTVSEGK